MNKLFRSKSPKPRADDRPSRQQSASPAPSYSSSNSVPAYNPYSDGAYTGNTYADDKGYLSPQPPKAARSPSPNPYATSSSPQQARNPYTPAADTYNPYAQQNSRARDELFGQQGRTQQVQQQRAPSPNLYGFSGEHSENYDPSIMETEQERMARTGDRAPSVYGDKQCAYGQYNEEEEDEETFVRRTKQAIKEVNKQTIATAGNATNLADQAIDTGLRVLGKLNQQGQRLTSAEFSVADTDVKLQQTDKELYNLKVANRPLFMPHIENPMSSKNRNREQATRNAYSRKDMVADKQRAEDAATQEAFDKYGQPVSKPSAPKSRANNIYTFEADSEDEEDEQTISQALDGLNVRAGQLRGIAGAVGNVLDEQNERLARLDDSILSTDAKMHSQINEMGRYTRRKPRG
ncbi:uncharacterized protein V1518DRAFT_412300 [Limtongia smithiae]|uniref:uncharacterized protein n=1 Tax=Limtongia smithiae TaxID=1125753 RepID=UPI0034CFADF1